MSTAVLLAEPEAETQAFLARHLKSDGFEVAIAKVIARLIGLGVRELHPRADAARVLRPGRSWHERWNHGR